MIQSIPTLAEFLTNWYIPARLGIARSTQEQYAIAVAVLDEWNGAPVRFSELTTHLFRRFLADYLKSRSAATVNSKRRAILTLWNAAVEEGFCEPPGKIATAAEPQRLPEAWTIDQVDALVVACRAVKGEFPTGIRRGPFWSSLVIVTYWTGARVSTLRSTRSADVNLADRYLVTRQGKTRRDRLHWLPDQAIAAIAAHYDAGRDLVWPWPHCRRHFWRSFRKIVEQAGIPSEPGRRDLFHKLRRTNLSYTAALAGPDAARRQAGHADYKTTERHYIDPRIAKQPSAVDFLPPLKK